MIRYQQTPDLEVQDFIRVLELSGRGSRRPIEKIARIQQMLFIADLIVTARDEETGHIVGVARSLTDFSHCCYVSDLAVDRAYQRNGIGRVLLEYTAEIVGPACSVVLIAAPEGREFYSHIDMSKTDGAFIYRRQL